MSIIKIKIARKKCRSDEPTTAHRKVRLFYPIHSLHWPMQATKLLKIYFWFFFLCFFCSSYSTIPLTINELKKCVQMFSDIPSSIFIFFSFIIFLYFFLFDANQQNHYVRPEKEKRFQFLLPKSNLKDKYSEKKKWNKNKISIIYYGSNKRNFVWQYL